jgi:primosomal protein N' (replication factor Y)
MISKGLHFPGVTVVGVVAADQSLNMPDFRAAERTFQLLTQVAGRAGRGNEPGEVYIQTYHPEHFAIIAASNHDYEAFYTEELRLREEANYPPFSYLANIVVSAPSAEAAQKHCQSIAEIIGEARHDDEAEILGPAPAPLAKLKDRYRYHFLLRAQEPGVIQRLLNSRREHLGSRGKIHVVVDVDPVSLM